MKPLAWFLLFLATPSAFADPACRVESEAKEQVVLRLGDQRVTLVGWEHNLDDDENLFADALVQSLPFAMSHRCGAAQKVMEKAARRVRGQIEQARVARARLEDAYRERPFQKIGIEISPEEMQADEAERIRMGKNLARMMDDCKFPASLREDLNLYFAGPDHLVADAHSGQIEVEGVEGQAARTEALGSVKRLSKVSETARLPILRASLQERANSLMEGFNEGEEITPVQVCQLQADIADPAKSAPIVKILNLMRDVSEGTRHRNQAIAENVVGRPDSYAVLIGRAHLRDLRDRLVQTCERTMPAMASR